MKNRYVFQSPIGMLELMEENGRLTNVCLRQDIFDETLLQTGTFRSDLLYEAYIQLNEYFKGDRIKFDLPLNAAGTPFQQQVWAELQNIPYGETRSYEDIAVAIGNQKAVRAVGQANNKNPILILVPCHRVIHKNGDMGGFGCGQQVKQYLLKLESDRLGAVGRLPEDG